MLCILYIVVFIDCLFILNKSCTHLVCSHLTKLNIYHLASVTVYHSKAVRLPLSMYVTNNLIQFICVDDAVNIILL